MDTLQGKTFVVRTHDPVEQQVLCHLAREQGISASINPRQQGEVGG